MTEFQTIKRKDSQGREWLLEIADGEGEEEIRKQLEMKEAISVQLIIDKDRTLKQATEIYDKIAAEKDSAKIINLMFRTISWASWTEFRNRTLSSILSEKLPLVTNDLDKKVIQMAINALDTKGGIPKKLKAIYTAVKGGSEDDDED